MAAAVALRLMPFIAFLQRHLVDIPHQQLLLVHDNETAVVADSIADAIHAIPVATTCINWSLQDKIPVAKIRRGESIPIVRFKLIISLVLESRFFKIHHNGVGFHCKYMFVSSDTSARYAPKIEERNAVHVILRTDRVEFNVWSVKNSVTKLVRIPDVQMFVRSVYWPRFRGELTRMVPEADMVGVVVDYIPTVMYPVLHENRKKLTGALVGIDQMIAGYIGVRQLNYQFQGKVPSFPVVRTVAAGQTSDYIPYTRSIHWSFFFQREGDWIANCYIRYRVLAPRKPIVRAGGFPGDWQQLVYVTVLLGVSGALAAIRLYFRHHSSSRSMEFVALLFDTFSRLLSISPGCWNGAEAERVFLTVIAVVSVLLGGLFSGILYQGNMLRTVTEQYNTIQDLCADQVEVLLVPIQVIGASALEAVNAKSCVNIGHLQRNEKLHPGKAYILNDMKISKYFDAATHHMLADPYGTFPVPLFVSHWYLEHPILLVIGRLIDHGIWMHFEGTAWHSAIVTSVDVFLVSMFKVEAEALFDWHFGWSILVFGWVVSAGGLLGEVAVAIIWTKKESN